MAGAPPCAPAAPGAPPLPCPVPGAHSPCCWGGPGCPGGSVRRGSVRSCGCCNPRRSELLIAGRGLVPPRPPHLGTFACGEGGSSPGAAGARLGPCAPMGGDLRVPGLWASAGRARPRGRVQQPHNCSATGPPHPKLCWELILHPKNSRAVAPGSPEQEKRRETSER